MSRKSQAVRFSSAGNPACQLEGRLHRPEGLAPFPAAVVAHPHPLWGGSMDSTVVIQIARTLAERGCAALRFNFRGVGSSQGGYGEGDAEIDDVIGALDFLLRLASEVDDAKVALTGYSFGAWVAGRAIIRDDRACAYGAVALPVSNVYSLDLNRSRIPKCFITGALDTVSAPELLRLSVGALSEPKMLCVIPGADHSLLGYEQEVADRVADWLLDRGF